MLIETIISGGKSIEPLGPLANTYHRLYRWSLRIFHEYCTPIGWCWNLHQPMCEWLLVPPQPCKKMMKINHLCFFFWGNHQISGGHHDMDSGMSHPCWGNWQSSFFPAQEYRQRRDFRCFGLLLPGSLPSQVTSSWAHVQSPDTQITTTVVKCSETESNSFKDVCTSFGNY